jgi:hypothetical protein
MSSYLAPVFGITKDASTRLAVVAMALATSRIRCITMLPNNRVEHAHSVRSIHNGEAPFFAAHPFSLSRCRKQAREGRIVTKGGESTKTWQRS